MTKQIMKSYGTLYSIKLIQTAKDEIHIHDLVHRIAYMAGMRLVGEVGYRGSDGSYTAMAVIADGHLVLEYKPEGALFLFLGTSEPVKEQEILDYLAMRGFDKVRFDRKEWN